jgi:hypothetical protein
MIVVTFAIAIVCAIIGSATGQTGLVRLPAVRNTGVTLWFLVLVWALGSALRARHGRYRIALVSADDLLKAFD